MAEKRPEFGDPEAIKHTTRIIGNVERPKDDLFVCVVECSCGLVFCEDADDVHEDDPVHCPACEPDLARASNRWARPEWDAPGWDSRRRMYVRD